MFDTPALWLAFVGMVPLMLVVIVSDLKQMRIPNAAILGVLLLFFATGSWGLPFDVFLWRIVYGMLALVIGFGIFSLGTGAIGAGDLKLIAVLVPFVQVNSLVTLLLLFSMSAILLIAVHQIARLATRKQTTGWKSFDQAVYLPAGVALGVSMIAYMGLELSARMA